ncbi:rod shape-determining protein MreC [Yunchengibacter salinarum]|uniref:rod shape-determining protein MreC n=1 Tax=Yunchengibacter salinarum TaxID=3133399 RepID=UPI0035B64D2F
MNTALPPGGTGTTPLAGGVASGARFQRRGGGEGRVAFWLYAVVALLFLLMETLNYDIPGQVRGTAGDVVAPVLDLLERPISATQSGLERLAGVSDIYLENQRLTDENDRLRQWRAAAIQLRRENERLRTMLKVPGREVPIAATGRVIGVGGGAFERSVIINVGRADGVSRNWPVVDRFGLVGRIIHVGQWSSRVLLVNDLNSHVPVRIARTGDLAMGEGRNSERLRLTFLPPEARVQDGDRVTTSGHGGVYPPDLPLARVVSVGREEILMSPLAGLDRLDYVRVLAYDPPAPEREQAGGRTGSVHFPLGEAASTGGDDPAATDGATDGATGAATGDAAAEDGT